MSGGHTVVSVTDGGPNSDGTRLVRVRILWPGGREVDFGLDAKGAVELGEALTRAGLQGMGR